MEDMVLDWTCPEERNEQRLCCCYWMETTERGRKAEADPKLPGVALQRRRETDKEADTWARAGQAANNCQQWS